MLVTCTWEGLRGRGFRRVGGNEFYVDCDSRGWTHTGMQILHVRGLESKQRAEKEKVSGRSLHVALDVVLVLQINCGDSSHSQ